MAKHIVGIVAPISGRHKRIGEGISLSFRYIIESYKAALAEKGIEIEVVDYDDKSDPLLSLSQSISAEKAGCTAIVGPADSSCAYALAREGELSEVPFILSFATINDDVISKSSNFFRVTSPNSRRSDTIIRQIKQDFPGSSVRFFSLDGGEHTYSMNNHRQLVRCAEEHGIDYSEYFFSVDNFPECDIRSRAPIIISAPSFEGNLLLRELKARGLRSAVYGFGSNSNWLNADAVGLVVVCDLDRNDRNPQIRERLRSFEKTFKATKDPSIPTMLAGLVIVQAIEDVELAGLKGTIGEVREQVMQQLRHSVFKGIVGNVKFDGHGEMIGHEQLSLVKVVSKRGAYSFSGVEQAPSAIVSEADWYGRKALNVLMVASAVAGIAGLAIAVIALI